MNDQAMSHPAVPRLNRRQRIRAFLCRSSGIRCRQAFEVAVIATYYSFAIAFLLLILLEVWRNGSFLYCCAVSTYFRREVFAIPSFRSAFFVMIGGSLGAMLYCIRMLIYFYADKKAYDSRWFVKYITAPVEGAALSLIVYMVLRGGLAALGGLAIDITAPINHYAAFGLGALIGFSLRAVIRWLINVGQTMFAPNRSQP